MILMEVEAVRKVIADLEPTVGKIMLNGFLDRVAAEIDRLMREFDGMNRRVEEMRAELELLKGQVRSGPRRFRKAARKRLVVHDFLRDDGSA